jgi:hypothetical protein
MQPWFKISSKFLKILTISRVGEFFAFRSRNFGLFEFLCKNEHGSTRIDMYSGSAAVGKLSTDQ